MNRQAKDVTVVKYNETEANVFANLSVNLVEKETESEHSSDGRQITVFTKENNVWKVSSVYYIGNEE